MTLAQHPTSADRSRADGTARLRFRDIEVDIEAGQLRAGGCVLDIEPQPRKLLLHLIRNRHRVVSRPELEREVWGNEVSTDALGRAILKARRAIGDDRNNPVLRTVPRVGYRFTAPAEADGDRTDEPVERTFLAFLPFANASGDPALAWTRLGLPVLVGEALARSMRVQLVAMSSVLGALGGVAAAHPAEQVAAIRRATGASAVVSGQVSCHAGRLRLDFRLFSDRGTEAGSIHETRPLALATGLAMALGQHVGVAAANDLVAALDLPEDPLAAEAYVRGRQAALEQRAAAAINLFRLSLELEPGHICVALELLVLLARTTTGATVEIPAMAADLLERAQRSGDRRTMVNVHLALAHWRACSHDPVASEREVRRALELSDGSEGPLLWGDVHGKLAVAAFGQGRQAEALEHVAKARALLEQGGDRVKLLAAMLVESGILQMAGDCEGTAELALRVAREARQLSLIRLLSYACNNACVGLIGLGRIDEAVALAAEGFACGVSVPDRTSTDQLAETVAFACRLAGRPSIAGRVLAELDALPGQPYSEGIVAFARALHHACRGDWPQAAAHARRAFEDAMGTHHTRFAAYAFPWYIEALLMSGCLDEAQAEIDRTDAEMLCTCERGVHLFLVRGALAHRRGERQGALDWLNRALQTQPSPLWRAWACADAAWLHAEDGRVDEGARLLAGLDGPLAGLPLVVAARARVGHASGDTRGAAALHRQYADARQEPAWHDYFERLGAAYVRHAGGCAEEPPPPIPFLPSRIC